MLQHDLAVLVDHDYHPDEATVRVFRTPDAGVRYLDDGIVVTEGLHEGTTVLRHYAFGDRWFKINVTTDLGGTLVETGHQGLRFAVNCDIATPMERDGDGTFAVDLFIDVLVRSDGWSYIVGDEAELDRMLECGLVSATEARRAKAAAVELVEIVERRELLGWLDSIVPFAGARSDPPPALAMSRERVPSRLRAGVRSSW